MTIEEATAVAGWIQKAFPHMKMTPRLYVRALVHYDVTTSREAILAAISNQWTRMPNVNEVVKVVRAAAPSSSNCETCSGDRLVHVGGFDYAPCPDCHPLSGTDYYLAGEAKNYRATTMNAQALDPAKVRELMGK